MHPALKELYKIIQQEDWTDFCPERTRLNLLDKWVDKWVVELNNEQAVVNPKALPIDSSDTIKVYMAQVMAEDLGEECTTYKTERTKISANLVALRRKAK